MAIFRQDYVDPHLERKQKINPIIKAIPDESGSLPLFKEYYGLSPLVDLIRNT